MSDGAAMSDAEAAAAAAVEVRDVSVDFLGADAEHPTSAVHHVSFDVHPGEIFGLVGESGCGKSTLALAMMGLLPARSRLRGSVVFEGRDVTSYGEDAWRPLRGNRISLISQDPRAALDPVLPIGEQVAETIRAHRPVSRRQARAEALEALALTGISRPADRYDDPPHRFSGGMCQRVVIAAALANHPDVLIADEPTTALDVTIQAQILELLQARRDATGMAIVLITHDMGVVAQMCDRVGVMYAGELVELGRAEELFASPAHPYTDALLAAIPTSRRRSGALRVIPGQVPDLSRPPSGCRFKDRCAYRWPECDEPPALRTVAPLQAAACWRAGTYRRAEAPTAPSGEQMP